VRKALILLAVVAVLILVVGALNNGTVFDIDYVAGTVNAVSLLWVSAVIAALVFVVGLAAAWFAQAAMTGSRRKLEAELQSTYERLREAEALAERRAPVVETAAPARVPEVVSATVVAAREAATVVETEDVTVVSAEAETVSGDESAPPADEAATILEPGEAGTAGPDAAQAAEEPAAETAAGEQTAITMAGDSPGDDTPAEPDSGESAEAGPADDATDQQPSS
jgi:hypothetical protein